LIMTGQQAIDGDTAQVGPGIAAHLKLPQTCFVRKIDKVEGKVMTVQRLMEDGSDLVEMNLPALVSVVKEINTPRLPSLRGKMKSKSVQLQVWNCDDLGLDEKLVGLNGSPTQVMHIFTPKHDKRTEKFEGDPDEAVEKIITTLNELTK
ncbi:MAG: electron transfer flavoprotein subunit beta/FixA family protein, partial [Candidatus Cloacimonadaceae bacterium]